MGRHIRLLALPSQPSESPTGGGDALLNTAEYKNSTANLHQPKPYRLAHIRDALKLDTFQPN